MPTSAAGSPNWAHRHALLRLCVDLAEIDARVDEGESVVLGAAVEHWGLHHEMLDKPAKASVAGHD